MQRLIGKVGLIGAFLLVFVLGGLIGMFGASYLYYRYVFSKAVDEAAVELGWQIRTLSQLRLGETDSAINDIEMGVDANIRSIALTPHIPITDYRYKVLRAAKTYREIYPSKSEISSQVNDALREIPKIDTFKCEGPLCRLVKQAEENKAK